MEGPKWVDDDPSDHKALRQSVRRCRPAALDPSRVFACGPTSLRAQSVAGLELELVGNQCRSNKKISFPAASKHVWTL